MVVGRVMEPALVELETESVLINRGNLGELVMAANKTTETARKAVVKSAAGQAKKVKSKKSLVEVERLTRKYTRVAVALKPLAKVALVAPLVLELVDGRFRIKKMSSGDSLQAHHDKLVRLERQLVALTSAVAQANAVIAEQGAQIAGLRAALVPACDTGSRGALTGRQLALQKMADVSAHFPDDRYVSFCLANGEYVTGATELDVIDKFEARFGTDQDGWVERIRRGPRDDNPGHGG